MKAIFGNGTELAYLNALETEEFWGGSNRRTLTFTCEADAISVDELNGILSDSANTASLPLINEESGITNLYEGYTKKLKIGIEPMLIQPDSPDSPAQYVDRLVIKLGKPTFTEQALAALGIPMPVQ